MPGIDAGKLVEPAQKQRGLNSGVPGTGRVHVAYSDEIIGAALWRSQLNCHLTPAFHVSKGLGPGYATSVQLCADAWGYGLDF